MLKSLFRYIRNFTISIFFKRERNIVLHDFTRYYSRQVLSVKENADFTGQRTVALKNAVDWLLHSQDSMTDDGFGSYHIIKGWSSSYVETSGYIVPTLIDYGTKAKRNDIIERALLCTDWLISVQKPSGGWQGEYIADNRQEVVFNTGQVIRAQIAAYHFSGKSKYLESAEKACDWLCSIQESEGYWKKFAFLNVARVYDSYVDAPLLAAYKIIGKGIYREKAVKNLNWIIEKKQHENGWFEDCDNTLKRNKKPILHTISYTIDGLIDCGIILNDERIIKAATKSADKLLETFVKNKYLNGRYDCDWKGSESMIVTGCAQLSIIWLKLYKLTNDNQYLDAAIKLNNQLVFIQDRKVNESANTKGALPGSFPLWGRYEPFCFPNWATKYFIDSLLLEQECRKKL